MSKNSKVYFEDILSAIKRIGKYTEKIDYNIFKQNTLISDAVMRNLTIIGEAVKSLSAEIKRKYDEIDWKKIAGFRDVVIHRYSDVDLQTVWDIVKNKLSELKRVVEKALDKK